MKKIVYLLVFGFVALAMMPAVEAALVVVGSLQNEQGDPADWDPPNSSLIMTEASAGVHTYTAGSLVDGTLYEFKVLDDGGSPPVNWGAPEVVAANTMAYGDADGSVEITVDTNNSTVWVNSDGAPLQVVGNFMAAAGGAGDWNPSDPAFAMTSEGSGYYTFSATIGTAGSYEFKVTDGTGWDRQIGPGGFSNNASTHAFSTATDGETVVMFVDTAGGSIGIVPEPSTLLMGLGGLLAMAARRRR